MKLLHFQGTHPNFGDDLNHWLWPQLIPDFFDEDDGDVFIGIGSIIGADFVQSRAAPIHKIVFGAGFVPSYHALPDVRGLDWDIYFVRGPRTARALKIPADLALGDAAILVRGVVDLKRRTGEVVSFMPHWESMERGNWEVVCRMAGINLIDPRGSVDAVLEEILRSKLVIAEAMHGAVVADALRVPWVPVVPMNKVHREKWFDWAEALQMDLRPRKACPSSLMEARLSFVRKPVTKSRLAPMLETLLTHSAAYRLSQLARAQPRLSDDNVIGRVHERMLDNIDKLKLNDYRRRFFDRVAV